MTSKLLVIVVSALAASPLMAQMTNVHGNVTMVNDILVNNIAVQEVSSTYQLPGTHSVPASWNGQGFFASTFTQITTNAWSSSTIEISTLGHSILTGNTGSAHVIANSEVGGSFSFFTANAVDLWLYAGRSETIYGSPFGASVVFDGHLVPNQGSQTGFFFLHASAGLTHSLSFSLYCDPEASGAANFDRLVTSSFRLSSVVPEPAESAILGVGLLGLLIRKRRR